MKFKEYFTERKFDTADVMGVEVYVIKLNDKELIAPESGEILKIDPKKIYYAPIKYADFIYLDKKEAINAAKEFDAKVITIAIPNKEFKILKKK